MPHISSFQDFEKMFPVTHGCIKHNLFEVKIKIYLGNIIFVQKLRKEQLQIQCSFNSVAQQCPTLRNFMDCSMQASLSIANSWSLLKLMSIESVMPSKYLILCHPLLPPSIFPSIRAFSNESVLCIRRQKYQEFQLQHQSLQ